MPGALGFASEDAGRLRGSVGGCRDYSSRDRIRAGGPIRALPVIGGLRHALGGREYRESIPPLLRGSRTGGVLVGRSTRPGDHCCSRIPPTGKDNKNRLSGCGDQLQVRSGRPRSMTWPDALTQPWTKRRRKQSQNAAAGAGLRNKSDREALLRRLPGHSSSHQERWFKAPGS